MQITLQNSKQRALSEAPELDSLFMFSAHFWTLKEMQAVAAKQSRCHLTRCGEAENAPAAGLASLWLVSQGCHPGYSSS